MSLQRLNASQMKAALESIEAETVQYIETLTETDKEECLKFLSDIALLNPYYILRPDALQLLNRSIFSSLAIRNLIFHLTFKHFAIEGNENAYAKRLAISLQQGISIDGYPGQCLLDRSVSDSCPIHLYLPTLPKRFIDKLFFYLNHQKAEDKIIELLSNNKYLMIVLLLCLSK